MKALKVGDDVHNHLLERFNVVVKEEVLNLKTGVARFQ